MIDFTSRHIKNDNFTITETNIVALTNNLQYINTYERKRKSFFHKKNILNKKTEEMSKLRSTHCRYFLDNWKQSNS